MLAPKYYRTQAFLFLISCFHCESNLIWEIIALHYLAICYIVCNLLIKQ